MSRGVKRRAEGPAENSSEELWFVNFISDVNGMAKAIRMKKVKVKVKKGKVTIKNVVVKPPRPKIMVMSMPRSISESQAAYRVAIRNPFSPAAIGARVPDSYSYPTVCYHINATLQCTPVSGNFEIMLLPSPCFSYIVGAGTYSGLPAFSANTTAGYTVSPTIMATYLTTFRVVAWGVRIILKDTQTNTKGRFYCATVPTPRSGVTWGILNANSAGGQVNISSGTVGYVVGTATPAGVQSLSSCTMFSTQDMLQTGSRAIAVSPSHVSQYEFRGVQDGVTWGTLGVGDAVAVNSSGVVLTDGMHDPVNLAGGAAVIVFGSGMETGNVFDLDLVYHLEGTPAVQNNGAGTTFAPSAQDVVVGDTNTTEKELAKARNSGQSDFFRPTGDSLTTKAFKYVGGAVQDALPSVGRTLGRAALQGGVNMFLNNAGAMQRHGYRRLM